jgi:hypothetical protein
MAIAIASWGILGVALFLVRALAQLLPFAWEVLGSHSLEPLHWAVLLPWVAFSAYAEGYRGFHQKFSPRVVGRALELGESPTLLRVLFAAPYSLGLFSAPRRMMLRGWALVLVISALVFIVRRTPQPWRGVIDAGVVVGLAIGLVSLLGRFLLAVTRRKRLPQAY